MGIWMAIDYGKQRCGIAVTDELKIAAYGKTSVDTPKLWGFFEVFLVEELVDKIVIGLPLNLQGTMNEVEGDIQKLITKINKKYPQISIERIDERFTSKIAKQTILTVGKKKKDRQNKYLVDQVSATLILQSYLETQSI